MHHLHVPLGVSTPCRVARVVRMRSLGGAVAANTRGECRIPETLSDEVLGKMHAPPKDSDVPVLDSPATLEQYDAFLLGIPTRYGNFPAQWKVCKVWL